MDGIRIYNIHDTDKGYQEGKEALIWGDEKGNCAELAIPLSVLFVNNQEHCINIELSSDCPWYNINDNEPRPILVPITFDVSYLFSSQWNGSKFADSSFHDGLRIE